MTMTGLEKFLREPWSAITHLAATVLAFVGTLLMAVLTQDQPAKMVSLIVYGASMTVLFAASTLLHGLRVDERKTALLNRLDHMAIFLLIAGTYTPIAYNFMPPQARFITLAAVWLVALGGMALKLFSERIDGFYSVVIYVVLSWGGALPLVLILRGSEFLTLGALLLLAAGGVIYTVGFVIYYWHRPDPWPGVFGHHEVWHLCVIGASFCHYLFMLLYVVPARTVA